MALPRIRIVAFNDVYELKNLPRVQTFLSQLSPVPSAVVLAGDFLSPSTLSALDSGKGMVATLGAVGVTHACLGNHEADVKLSVLRHRLHKLASSSGTKLLNANIGPHPKHPWLAPGPWKDDGDNNWSSSYVSSTGFCMPTVAVVSSPCQRVKIGFAGLMSDEDDMFRDGTFRGAPIENILKTVSAIYHQQKQSSAVDLILPVTHQSIRRDQELAQYMLENQIIPDDSLGLILGGHEHESIDDVVHIKDAINAAAHSHHVRILKSGCDAEAVSLIDLTFDRIVSTCPEDNEKQRHQMGLVDIEASLVEMSDFSPSVPVSNIVNAHMALLNEMDDEIIVNAKCKEGSLLPPGVALSSVGTRRHQTTLGGIFCTACKDELDADVAVINGATIKGSTTYEDSSITYSQLKNELPFPTKMVVVQMKRFELQEAIHYSRTYSTTRENDLEDEEAGKNLERRGYLQVDSEFEQFGFHTGSPDDDLYVSLPRNLLNGFCQNKPLMEFGQKLKARGEFPSKDDFVPAIDLVVRHFSKERWYDIVRDQYTFDDLDTEHKGFLTRNDVKHMLRNTIGHEPAEFVVDDMVAAVDVDGNGIIDPGEFNHLHARMERSANVRFDE